MLCNYCYGTHFISKQGRLQPCEACGGCGEVHCCDGIQAQPEMPTPETHFLGENGFLKQEAPSTYS
jgi:hypothetical protein